MRACAVVLWAVIGVFAASPVAAQTPPAGERPGPGFAARRRERLFKDITLTAEQRAKIDSIAARYRAERPAFTPGAPPDSATRARVRQLVRAELDEIRAVLAPDQQQVWDRNLATLRAGRPNGP